MKAVLHVLVPSRLHRARSKMLLPRGKVEAITNAVNSEGET